MLMSEDIAGRDAELEAVEDFLAKISSGSAALVLEGEAGMGKTTLWRAAVENAREQGLTVLQAQPVESETTLSFAGIGDLLDPFLDVSLDGLAPVQRRALERALALGEEDGQALDPRVLRVAVMSSIRMLAADRPVLLAIDDSQWLDYASSAALAYGVRRFRTEHVGLLLSRRSGLESVLLNELVRSPAGNLFTRIHVDPLDVVALGRVIHVHLGSSLPRPLLAEVHDASGGNPFFALEIVRMLQRTGVSIEAGQPLPLPESLQDLVNGRVTALSNESRDFLLAAAAHAHPTIGTTEAASGVVCADGLEPALEARVVELDGERIRFTHPLLAAGVYEAASPLRRVEIHRRLAELLEDPEARAWQLAASVDRPDEAVAAAIEDAAEVARMRGALRPAALLLDRARELTPPNDEGAVRRRRVAAAYAHHAAGDTTRARLLLEPAIEQMTPGHDRAALLVALARVRSYDDDVRGASALYEQAIGEAEPGSLVEAYAQEGLGGTLFRLRERLAEAVDISASAAVTARRLDATWLEAETLATKAVAEATLGRSDARATSEAAVALQSACADRPVLRQPLFAVTCVRFWHDDLLGAHEAYEAMAASARELGDESSLPYTYVMLGQIDCALGRFEDALLLAEQGHEIAEQAGQRALVGYTLAVRMLAAAHLGRSEDVVSAAGRALDVAQATSGVPTWIFATWALGHLALAQGDPAGAYDTMSALVEHHRREAICEPGALPFYPDAAEALVEAGRLEDAEVLIAEYGAAADRLGRRRAIAASQRARGLLAGARGDPDAAHAAFAAAVELYAAADTPFELARSLLGLGVTQRRMKRRREARSTLEDALEVFEGLGAALWAERARAELKRISGRAATPGALTPAEERVAALVLQGKTNKEVAAALFLSDRTVEGHLARIFGKLGIRHRTELARALQTQGIEASNTGDSPVSAETVAP